MCELGAIGFYRPDPGGQKSPMECVGIHGDRLRVHEIACGLIFDLDAADWMSHQEFVDSTISLVQGKDEDAILRLDKILGRVQALGRALGFIQSNRSSRWPVTASEWDEAYRAFVGAFDTPQLRRIIDNEYAADARRRLKRINEAIFAGGSAHSERRARDESIRSIQLSALASEDEDDDLRSEMAWLKENASFSHVDNDDDGPVWEMMLNLALDYEDIPGRLAPIIDLARLDGVGYLIFYLE